MWTTESGLLVAMLTAPALVAAGAFTVGRRTPRRFAQAGAATAWLGLLGALILAVGAGQGRSAGASLLLVEFDVDRLAAVLLLLVFGVSAIVQTYAIRYLAGDPRQGWFVGGAGLLTVASVGLATATTLITLALCWSLAGLALCLLLGTYWHLPAARDGVRRTAAAFAVGDLALWIAVALVTATWGRIDLRELDPGRSAGALLPVIALLVVIAALSRSAQIPFHRWLPATLAAPTPVSALLHAGVVNAGGILLVRLAPLASDELARAVTILAGAATMVYGTTIMLVKPDIKGSLVNSTTAQMGFMILTCGLGLWAAAVIHLVAHGFYKATLFLSSGSAIAAQRRHEALPAVRQLTRTRQLVNAAAAVAFPAAALIAAVAVVPLPAGDHPAEQALLLFALVTGAAATWGWLKRGPGLGGVLLGAAFLSAAAVAYVSTINAVTGFLDPDLPPSGLTASAVWTITVAAVVLLGALAAIRWMPGADRLRFALYARALSSGHIPGGTLRPASAQPTSTQLTGARS
jgi:NAD(P)H-quinone oxidoreductase subunit 5